MAEKVNTRDFKIAGFEYYGPGDVIFNEGASGDVIYIITRGEVEIYNMVEGQKVVVDKHGEGALFGEVSFIDHHPRSAAARALTNVTLAVVDRSELVGQYNQLPLSLQLVFNAMAHRLRRLTLAASKMAGRQGTRRPPAIRLRFNTADEFFKAYTAGVGGGSIFVRTGEKIDPGAEVELEFTLPGDPNPLYADGVVARRQDGPKGGLEVGLTPLNPKDKARLAAFVQKAIAG